MIADGKVVASIAVSDIDKGKKFYGETLGLKQVDENPGGVTYDCGGNQLFVYPSPTAGSGQATCAFFEVSDFDESVDDLKNKGIELESYDMPGMDKETRVMTMGDMKAAWFKDTDGNILGVGSV